MAKEEISEDVSQSILFSCSAASPNFNAVAEGVRS